MESKDLSANPPTTTGKACANLDAQQELIEACVATAEQLLRTATEERRILEGFQADALLEILPQKQHLVRSLSQKLASLEATADKATIKADPRLASLRDRLRQIEQVNQGNGVFIENTLAYYEDFLKRFIPVSYGFSENHSQPLNSRFYRGRAFTKEI